MKAANVWLIGLFFVVSASAEPLFEGQVRLESGEPVTDAQVRLFDLTDLRRFVGTTTDETGHFVLPLQAFSTDRGTALPTDFALGENYPNPFNPSTMKADGSVYGLTVSGEGLVAYVNPAFRVGVGEVDIVVEEHGGIPRMKRAAGGILGDVDGNGQVDVFDVLYVLLYSVDPSIVLPNNGDISRGDVNGDSMVEVADAVLLLRYLSNPSDPALPLGIGQDSDDTLVGATEVSLGSMDGDYRTWHLPDGAMARLGKGTIRDIAFSPVGQYLAVASGIGVWIYEVATSRALMLMPTASVVRSVSFSPDGATLASGSLDGTVRLWDVATGEPIATLGGRESSVSSVSFSADGATLASGSGRRVQLWAVVTGEAIATLEGHTDWVYSVSFSPDGSTLASGSWDDTVRLWAVATGEAIATLEGHTDWVYSVSFSPDGATLASGAGDGTVRLWDVVTGEPIATLEGHTDWVYSVSFSPDGATLASGAGDGTVRLWDVVTGEPIATLEGYTHRVESVSFSPDGATLASGAGGTILLWDVVTGEPIVTLEGHTHRVESVSFSPDGATLASGAGGTILLWDVVTGEPIVTLEGHTHRVESVSFSPDEATLASGALDGTILLWDVAEWTNSGTAVAANKLIGLPDELQLQQNAPNPFNSQTILSYFLPKSGMVRLELFSVTGQRVAVLRQGPQQAGYHRLHWDGRDDAGQPLASGTYLYRLVTDETILTRKFTLLR